MENNNIKLETVQKSTPVDTKYNTPRSNESSLNYKLILASILFVVIAFLLAYFLIFRKSAPTVVSVVDNTGFPVINASSTGADKYYTDNNLVDDDFAESEYSELVHIWPLSISGYSVLKKSFSTSSPLLTNIVFMDQESGGLYESREPLFAAKQISSELISNVLKSNFSYDQAYGAFLNNKFTLYLVSVPNIQTSFLEKTLLGENVLDFNFSKNSNKLAFLKRESSGSSLNLYDIVSKETVNLYNSPLSDLNVEWLNSDNILIKSKPSNVTTQTIMQINIKTKKVEILTSDKIINKILPDYKNIYFDGESLYYTDNIRSLTKNKINIMSIPDKCTYVSLTILCGESVGTSIYSLPDEWYKGNVSFIDYLTLYNTENNKYFRYDLSLIAGQSIDFYKPVRYLDAVTFINKRDLSLWLLDTGKILSE